MREMLVVPLRTLMPCLYHSARQIILMQKRVAVKRFAIGVTKEFCFTLASHRVYDIMQNKLENFYEKM